MSNLLNEAIVDAKALKEAALKNAETAIIQKYSSEVKDTLDRLLEQDDLASADLGLDLGAEEDPAVDDIGGMETPGDPIAADLAGDPPEDIDPDEEIPFAAADNLIGNPAEGTPTEFDLNLGALEEAIKELSNTLEEGQEYEFDATDIVEMLAEEDEHIDVGTPATGQSAETDEDENLQMEEPVIDEEIDLDGLVASIAETLTVDMGADLAGWAGRSSAEQKHEMELEMAHRRSTEVAEELKDLKKAQEELVFENKQLKEQNKQYKQATNDLKEGLQDVNLSNARLLYTNRVLRNTSLNERQKETIVEAISRAGSVMEARTIFDTLQSTAQATPKKSPQSLSEAITRRSSVIRASRAEKPSSDPFQDRMKRLAGIK